MKKCLVFLSYILFLFVVLPTCGWILVGVMSAIFGMIFIFPINLIALFIVIFLRMRYKEFLIKRKEIRRRFLHELGWQMILFFIPIVLSEMLITISGGLLLKNVSPILRMCHLSGYVDELQAMKSIAKISTKQMLKNARK